MSAVWWLGGLGQMSRHGNTVSAQISYIFTLYELSALFTLQNVMTL